MSYHCVSVCMLDLVVGPRGQAQVQTQYELGLALVIVLE